jgi:hypothetical protein
MGRGQGLFSESGCAVFWGRGACLVWGCGNDGAGGWVQGLRGRAEEGCVVGGRDPMVRAVVFGR